mgnify:CR=1 FL=1
MEDYLDSLIDNDYESTSDDVVSGVASGTTKTVEHDSSRFDRSSSSYRTFVATNPTNRVYKTRSRVTVESTRKTC